MNKYIVSILIPLIFLFLCNNAKGQQIRNTYKFYNSLSTTEKDCAEDLVPVKGLNLICQNASAATPGTFISDVLTLSSTSRTVYHNNLNWGLKYLNTNGVIQKTYTIQLYFRVTNFNKFYTRIIDFSDGTEDNGIYLTNFNLSPPSDDRCINFFPDGNFGPCPFFNSATYYLLTLSRNDATKIIDIYVNDRLFTTYNDTANFYVSSNAKPIHIFRDDPVGFDCEDGEANLAYLSFANYYSNQADVSAVYQNINTIAITKVADFSISGSTCAGKNATIHYTGNIAQAESQYTFNWDWDGGNIISGSGRGPYIINWAQAGNKNIKLDITGGECGTTITNTKQLTVNFSMNAFIDTSICMGTSFDGHTVPGTYNSMFTTAAGCDSNKTIILKVKSCDIFFPAAFSPDNNGRNETFKVLTNDNFFEYHLKIYDRYGKLLFETRNQHTGWDGRYRGELMDPGAYVWICNLKSTNTPEGFFKGAIMLLR